ncbi:AMP-binding protein [Umezawaea sp. Da 62-37]|uniref:AMP-binding protein n=1 Tax=Umezawaea sp. Da 62-37 TaxID=3075927 RepID=UPI0028F72B26|nr:AMP-binding protein [Umezawaea sp. Da 62-37]WNV85127.1 AMP-binding protein [Umezawaea sp. Da 62-37]
MSILRHVYDAARRHPDSVALVDARGRRTTYADLVSAVEGLAASVLDRVGRDARVAVLSGKEPRTVIAMLAVLRAGCSYVPVDASAPIDRQRFIVEDAGCALALDLDVGPATAKRPLPDEAYVLYTSGSTGTPKGVVITHANSGAFVDWARRAFPIEVGDQVAVHAPLHFDLPVYDVYVGLAAGATLHPVPERVALFPQALHRFLRDRAITHLYAVPSALTALLTRSTLPTDGLPALKQILYAGEEFRAAALADLMAAVPAATVANLYGPIETNVITSHVVTRPPRPEERIPVGRPVDGALIALLAADGTASFSGPAEGELVVAGPSVTPGYLGRPDLTGTATVVLTTSDGEKPFYRTGDIARRDRDGLLHLLGRRDGLVKTRGYRVEIGEVETALGTHPDLAEVVVVPVPDPLLTTRLHALVVPRPGHRAPSAADVVAHCRDRLPGYMVPGAVHVVADLPRTSTGKVARAELPALVTGEES